MADGMFKTDPKETETEGMNGGNIFRCKVPYSIPFHSIILLTIVVSCNCSSSSFRLCSRGETLHWWGHMGEYWSKPRGQWRHQKYLKQSCEGRTGRWSIFDILDRLPQWILNIWIDYHSLYARCYVKMFRQMINIYISQSVTRGNIVIKLLCSQIIDGTKSVKEK